MEFLSIVIYTIMEIFSPLRLLCLGRRR